MKQSLFNLLGSTIKGKEIYIYYDGVYNSLVPDDCYSIKVIATIASIAMDYDNAVDLYFTELVNDQIYINIGLDEEIEFVNP